MSIVLNVGSAKELAENLDLHAVVQRSDAGVFVFFAKDSSASPAFFLGECGMPEGFLSFDEALSVLSNAGFVRCEVEWC